jgi:hypothetical protein
MAARRTPAKKPARSKEPAPKQAKKVKEPKVDRPGPPVESVLAVITGIMLLTAFFLVDYTKGRDYGTGLFFKGSYEASR